ncbi:MAG: hypothetical protein QOD09_309 [Bradyrhizobium sp.]|jgi:hypothetical protein|nr:hypothetical protein [Bradyrhizobium sp.]
MANITILNPATNQNESAAASTGNAAQAALAIGPYPQRSLVLVTGQGQSKFSAGGGQNAGIVLSLKVNSATVAKDDSFEGESSNLHFMASASHNFLLAANAIVNVQARVDHLGAGGVLNTDTNVNLKCFALAM